MKYMAVVLLLVAVMSAHNAPSTNKGRHLDISAIAREANGSVVSIVMSDKDGHPLAQGSGFLISKDGQVVTNYHVIKNGSSAVIKLPDGAFFAVDGVLAFDKHRDVAIIKAHGNNFRSLTLGDSDRLQVGQQVIAIGSPLSLESTVSNGIISGVRTAKELGKFLQTTAPISPGSSGGPLFNMRGEVVGINTLYLEGGENLNFAIPVNDAKLLLSHQSAKLQNLPNQHESAPTDAPPSTTGEAPIAQTKQTKESYYVRAGRNETYIIEYRGHQLTAHCRESLTWDDGEDKLGSPMAEHECVYLLDKVGKHISGDLMVWQDNELRYRPWTGFKTEQTADILDITDDVLLGAPKRPHPAPKTSPEIQKTLHWIQNTLADEEGTTIYSAEKRVNRLPDVNGCQVTFVYATRIDWKETFHTRQQVNLGDLDPTSLTSGVISHEVLGDPVSMVRVHTTDKKPSVSLAINDRGWIPARVMPTTDLLWELPSPYAERFVKALRGAITLCGGKASAF